MKSKRLSDVFACLMAVLSESVPIALQTSGIEILGSSRWHGSSHSLCVLGLNGLANEFAGHPICSGQRFRAPARSAKPVLRECEGSTL